MNTNYVTTFFENEIKTTVILILSQLTGLILAPLSIIAPLFIWLTFKDRYSMVDYYARQMINFSLHMLVMALIPIALMTIHPYYAATIIIPALITIVFNIICLVKISKGEKFHFPYTFKIIKGLSH